MTTSTTSSTSLRLSGTLLTPLIFKDSEELSNLGASNMSSQVALTPGLNTHWELHTLPRYSSGSLLTITLPTTKDRTNSQPY